MTTRKPETYAPGGGLQDLYIYYVRGRLSPGAQIGEDGFIGNWEEDDCSFLFFGKPASAGVEKLIGENRHLSLLDEFHMTYEDWLGKKPEPFSVGGFHIRPPWEPSPEKMPGQTEIILDPGVVFGDGTHPTTNDCLDILDTVCAPDRMARVLDLGTGTGLLAIAAARAGCEKTLAADLNLLAVRTAWNNIRLNRLENRVLAVCGRAEEFIDVRADLVIANIHYEIMKKIVGSGGFLEKRAFLLSGLLRKQAFEIERQLSELPVDILDKRERDGIWFTYYGRVCKD